MSQKRNIAIISGDGVGPELTDQLQEVIKRVNKKYNLNIKTNTLPYSADYYLETGISIPDDRIEEIKKDYDALFVGPLGDPRIKNKVNTTTILYKLRYKLRLFASIQNFFLYDKSLSPLEEFPGDNFNFYIIRESLEGINSDLSSKFHNVEVENIVSRNEIYTYKGVYKFIKTGVNFAEQQNKTDICLSINKFPKNSINNLWENIFNEVTKEYDKFETHILSIEQTAHYLLTNPGHFDIILTPGGFGDVLLTISTDLMGGYGLAFSKNFNPDSIPVYRILHKPRKKYVDTDQANPIGILRALSQFLLDFSYNKPARIIEKAINDIFEDNLATIDLGGILGTEETVDRILTYIEKH